MQFILSSSTKPHAKCLGLTLKVHANTWWTKQQCSACWICHTGGQSLGHSHDQSSHCPLNHCSITKWSLSSGSLNTVAHMWRLEYVSIVFTWKHQDSGCGWCILWIRQTPKITGFPCVVWRRVKTARNVVCLHVLCMD